MSRPPTSKTPTNGARRAGNWAQVCALALLFALGLRVVYVPYHLTQEEHLGSAGHTLAHLDGARGLLHDLRHHGSTEERGHEHEHDDDRAPHSALDHATDLVAQRAPTQGAHVDLAAAPGSSTPVADHSSTIGPVSPAPRPPRARPLLAVGPRGPPAAH